MTKYFNSTTYTNTNGEVKSLIWSDSRKQDADKALAGATDVQNIRMAYCEFPSILTTTTTGILFNPDEVMVVNGNGGTAWLCFTQEAREFVTMLEAAA